MVPDSVHVALVLQALKAGPQPLSAIAGSTFKFYSDTDAYRCAQVGLSTLVHRGCASGPDHRGMYSLTVHGLAMLERPSPGPATSRTPPRQQPSLFSPAPSVAPTSQTAGSPPAQLVHPPCTPPAAPMPALPPEGRRLFAVLESHKGAAAAITAPALAEAAGLWPDMTPANRGTRVREMLSLHQDDWPWPIVGDVDGYYRPATAAEITHCCANYRSRALLILRRLRTVRRKAMAAGFVHCGHDRFADPTPA